MYLSVLFVILGLVCLVKGGDWLVDGSVAIAERLKMTPMVIGMTIVAFGTSAPELLVSIQSAVGGNAGIALGNVIGSNIANIALILGVTAILCPIPVHGSTFKIDTPFLIFATLALSALCYFTGCITRIEGIVGLLLLFIFIAYKIKTTRVSPNVNEEAELEEQAQKAMPLWKAVLLLVISILLLKFGAQWLVQGATDIARGLGVSDRIIGLTIVAIGTSLPELFASVIAARKGNVDLAVGNVVGSNLFNIMCVLAAASAISPIDSIDPGFIGDCIWMLALTILIWIQLRTDYKLTRTEGFVLLSIYTIFLVLTII